MSVIWLSTYWFRPVYNKGKKQIIYPLNHLIRSFIHAHFVLSIPPILDHLLHWIIKKWQPQKYCNPLKQRLFCVEHLNKNFCVNAFVWGYFKPLYFATNLHTKDCVLFHAIVIIVILLQCNINYLFSNDCLCIRKYIFYFYLINFL